MTDPALPAEPDANLPLRGQRHLTWEEPGWVGGPGGQGRFNVLPLGDGDHDPVIAIVEYAPSVRIGVHHHESDYCSIVVKGELEVTRKREQVGNIRLVRAGTAYGPLVIGPQGCTIIEIFQDRTTFTAPKYLKQVDRDANLGSPMPALALQALAQAWSSSDEHGTDQTESEPG